MLRFRVSRVAALGVLALALGLSACGRKSGLDLPPGAAATPPAAESRAPQTLLGAMGGGSQPKPVAAPGPDRPIPLDVLLN